MNKEQRLYKNTGIIAIGTLSSKIFTFLLLPMYTSVLLPADYGTIDVIQTIINLLLYIVTLQIESAIFRFIIDKRDDYKECDEYISSGFWLIILNLCLSTLIILVFNYFHHVEFLFLFIICLWSNAFSIYMINVARGKGHNLLYSVVSFLITFSSLIVNIVLVLGVKYGAPSILIAFAFSNALGGMIIFIKERIFSSISIFNVNINKLRALLKYSLPLIPNAISWWIVNASDRLLIAYYLSSAMNGVYAAANKIPTIYTTFFNVYSVAWTEAIALSVNDNDNNCFVNDMMNKSLRLFSFLDLGIIVCMSLLFNVLIGSKYDAAYMNVYILMIAIFINSLSSMYGGILTGYKDSKAIGYSTMLGAIVNFSVNIVLIRFVGLYAASISTLISYIIIFIVRARVSNKFIVISFSKKYLVQLFFVFSVVSITYYIRNSYINIIVLLLLVVWGIINNRDIVKSIITMVLNKIGKNQEFK